MPPTAASTQKGYARMWDECKVTKPQDAAAAADRILANKPRYLEIERAMGIPWIMAASLHMRESSLNFARHMHNGDPLTGYTKLVPKGRPKVGHGPPFSFEESAADAFKLKGFDKLKGLWTVELMLFSEEAFNGWGYLRKTNSPYIWSWTNHYTGGKYIRDHVYDPNHWDSQPGCAALMKALASKDADAKRWVEVRAGANSKLPAEALAQQTRKERGAVIAGTTGTVAGGTGTVAPKPDAPAGKVAVTFASSVAVIVGLGIAIVAGVLLYRKTQALKARWTGVA